MTFNTLRTYTTQNPRFSPYFCSHWQYNPSPTQAEESNDFQQKGIGGDLALKQRGLTAAVTPAVPGHWGRTIRVQDEVASSGSHLPWGLLSHFLSSQIRCKQPPAPEQAGEVATKDGSRFCSLCRRFPSSLWYRTCQNHQLQVAAISQPHPPQVLLHSCPHRTTRDGGSGLRG